MTAGAAVVFVSQLAMIFFRLVNVRMVTAGNVFKSVLLTAAIQSTWLVSSALGIKGFLDGDYAMVCAYIAGGMAGSYLSFKIKV